MSRFSLQELSRTDATAAPGMWQVSDEENGIRISFEEHRFNDTQHVTMDQPELFASTNGVMQLARIMREIGDWIRKEHYDVAMPSLLAQRQRIGQTIQKLREERGLSKVEMARLAAITRANLDNIEAGRYSVGLDILGRIANVLGVSVQLK